MINLDETIRYSYAFLNKDSAIPNFLSVNNWGDIIHDFDFKNQTNLNIPVEHMGLAYLTYQNAINSFYSYEVDNQGFNSKVFKPLPNDVHIADILQTFHPDTLGWYKDKNDRDLTLADYNNNIVYYKDLLDYSKFFNSVPSSHFSNEYRLQTVQSSLDRVQSLYHDELIRNNCVNSQEELDNIMETENLFNQIRVNEMINNSFNFFDSQNDEFQEQ